MPSSKYLIENTIKIYYEKYNYDSLKKMSLNFFFLNVVKFFRFNFI